MALDRLSQVTSSGISTTISFRAAGINVSGIVTANNISVGSGTTYPPGLYSPGTDQLSISTSGTGRLFVDASGNIGINAPSPCSLLNIKGTTPRLTIGDSQSKTWAVGDTLSSIDFSSDDTSCGGTTDKVRTRIETYVADTFGCSHGLGFYAVDIVDGVLRKHITIGSRGELTLGHSRKNQTQIITLTQNSSTFYPIELRDTYNGTSANNSILFSSTLSDNTTLYNSASIGVLSSDKGTGGSGSLLFSTKNTSDSNPVERLRITSGGNVQIANGNLVFSTAGQGLDFSATSNAAGMTSELLDDYEEGTWSPSIYGTTTAGTTTYFQRAGTYTKVGRVVTVQVFVTITNQTGTGALRLGNLPFTAGSGANTFPCAVKIENLALFASHYPVFSVAGGTTYINMEQTPVGGGAIYGIAIDTAFNVELTATYFV
jgi:hypothetical protein